MSWMNASVGPIMIDKSFFSGIHFEQALFVPNQSQYNKLGSLASPPSEREEIDLSWQLSLQRVWESLPHNNEGCSKLHCETVFSLMDKSLLLVFVVPCTPAASCSP